MKTLDINTIKAILPHSYPFLLVDRITEIETRERIVGLKNVTINEPFFTGHFADNPIMPGVLILEALAQAGGVLLLNEPDYTGKYPYFTAIDKVKFRRPVTPGDQLRLEMTIQKSRDGFVKFEGHALVEGELVCEGLLTFTLAEQPSKPQIHPTATVDRSAILGKDVIIGPHAIVGENVVIGDRTKLEAHCLVEKWTRIGDDCHLHFGSAIGSAPQDFKYKGEKSWVVIGDRNEIREYVTINRATGKDCVTELGDDNLLLTSVHIGHNCKLGSNIIVTNMTNIAGHTTVEDKAIIGGMTGIHQYCRIGRGAMVGAYTRLPQDVPPYMLCEGNPALIRGLNLVGLRRNGATRAAINEIKEIHKIMFRSDHNTSQALAAIKELTAESDEAKHLITFLSEESPRGFTKKSEASD